MMIGKDTHQKMTEIICLSGGCKGADTIFGEQATLAKHKVVHWSFGGHYSKCKNLYCLTTLQLLAADKYLLEASKILKRNYPARFVYVNNLLRRNYYQIKDTERIYAVSSLDDEGIVKGGTGWAVAMGIQQFVPEIYLFDQEKSKWLFHHINWQWGDIDSPPPPIGIYTGIGASELNEAGRQAIVNLYDT